MGAAEAPARRGSVEGGEEPAPEISADPDLVIGGDRALLQRPQISGDPDLGRPSPPHMSQPRAAPAAARWTPGGEVGGEGVAAPMERDRERSEPARERQGDGREGRAREQRPVSKAEGGEWQRYEPEARAVATALSFSSSHIPHHSQVRCTSRSRDRVEWPHAQKAVRGARGPDTEEGGGQVVACQEELRRLGDISRALRSANSRADIGQPPSCRSCCSTSPVANKWLCLCARELKGAVAARCSGPPPPPSLWHSSRRLNSKRCRGPRCCASPDCFDPAWAALAP